MVNITPCQRLVSDRFPVASFVVQAPPERLFEIACATDPALFQAEQKHRRTSNNFFTTRTGGLLRAPAGQATYLLPPEQLRRFAGAQRLYYAVGSYASPRGDDPRFTVPLDAPERAPSIQVSADFTGRSLDRSRLGRRPVDARYGSSPGALVWGGDSVARRAPAPAKAEAQHAYDDGYPAELWNRPAQPVEPEAFGGAQGAPVDEPPGFEDAPAIARHGRPRATTPAPTPAPSSYRGSPPPPATRGQHHESYSSAPTATAGATEPRHAYGRPGRAVVEPEPAGFEDAPALARAGRAASAPRYGAAPAEVAAPRADAPPPVATAPMSGHDDSYQESAVDEDELPDDLPGAAVRELPSAGVPLTIPEKFKIVLTVARAESGADRYSAINADGEYNDQHHPAYQRYHIGLSWGIVQFTQRGGALGRVLQACQRRDPDRFRAVFGDASDQLLAVTTAPTEEERVQAVGGNFLWEEPWLGRFRAAGQVPAFQAAQNEVAIEGYLDPNLQFADWFGFDTDRSLAMLYDRCVNMGNGAGASFVARAVGPIRTRRQQAAALAALGKADLRAFQQDTPGLVDDGKWGPLTHAAMTAALRDLGADSPIAIPELSEMLDRLVDAARGRRFESRLRALRSSNELHDTVYELV
jgi:hypothetical protein